MWLKQLNRFFILIIIVLSSCHHGDDLLLELKLGSNQNQWIEKRNKLTEKKILFDKEDWGQYKCRRLVGDDSITLKYIFNEYSEQRNPSDTGNLLSVRIDFQEDTSKCVLFGPNIKKSIVQKVITYLNECYGLPDSISKKEKEFEKDYKEFLIQFKKENETGDTTSFIRKSFLIISKYYNSYSNEDEEHKDDFIDKWELDDMDIEFHRGPYQFVKCIPDTFYRRAYLIFKVKDFDAEIRKINEYILKNERPNDLLNIVFNKPTFTTGIKNQLPAIQLFQTFSRIERKVPEEKRAVTAVKFDIVYKNKFNEEVYRIKNCEYEFDNGLKYPTGLIMSTSFGYQNIAYQFNEKYDAIINLKNMDGVKVDADISKIVFGDETVLE